jgi:hypothetical protein
LSAGNVVAVYKSLLPKNMDYAVNGFDRFNPNTGGPYEMQVLGTEVPEPLTITLFGA